MSNILEYIIKLRDQASDQLKKFGINAHKVFTDVEGDEKKVLRTNKLLGQSYDSIGKSIDNIRAKARGTQIVTTQDIANVRAMNSEVKRLEALQNKMGSMNGSRLKGWVSDAASQIPGAGLMRNPLVLAAAAIGQGVKTSMGAERMENSIKYSLGANVGGQAISHIKNTSNKLGLDAQSMLTGGQTLFGSMKGYDPKIQMRLLEGVGKAGTSLGLDGEQTKGALLALGQIAGKGKVSMEELRQQLGERLPGAMQLAAKSMGVGTQEFNKMVEAGLESKEFLPRFAKTLNDEFTASAEKNSNSATAQWNRLKNSIYEISDTLGKTLLPIANTVFGALGSGIRFVTENIGVILPVLGFMATAWILNNAALVGYTIGTNLARLANSGLIKSVISLGRALFLTPIGWITLGLIGIMIALDALKKKFGSFQNILDAFKKMIKLFANAIVDEFKDIGDAIVSGISIGVLKSLDWLVRLGQSIKNFAANPMGGFNWVTTGTKYGLEADAISAARTVRENKSDKFWADSMKGIKTVWDTNNGFKGKGKGLFEEMQEKLGISTGGASGSNGNSKGATASKLSNGLNDVSSGITGGGTRNLTINLGKFQDSINITVGNATEAVNGIGDVIQDELLRILNSAGALAN
jgi:tape measure domain-containing protein